MDLIIQHIAQLVTLAGPKGPRSGAAMSDLGIIEDWLVAYYKCLKAVKSNDQ